jgi:hypothetical protein
MLKTFEEMCDEELICNYCIPSDYGEHKAYHTPSGYYMCEGAWCDEAYREYLENENATENLVKYQNSVKLLNRENLNGEFTEI